jgi:hypothetical protein
MRKFAIVLLVCGLLTLTGCDEEAQQYAGQLNEVLKSYQAQVNRKIKAEQEAYRSLSALYANAQEEEVFFRLALERNQRARQMAEELISGKQSPPTPSEIRAFMKDYANYDFEQTRVLLEEETEASARFLTELENLELEAKKIENLGKSLEELSKPKRSLRQLKEFVGFAMEVDKGVRKLACDDLDKEKKSVEDQLSKEQENTEKDLKKIDKLETRLAQIEAERESKKCS